MRPVLHTDGVRVSFVQMVMLCQASLGCLLSAGRTTLSALLLD